MSVVTYNALTSILLVGSLVAVVIAISYLIAAIVGWRGQHRSSRLVRFGLFLLAFPLLVATQQALLWYVFLPSLGDKSDHERQNRIDSVSYVGVGDEAPSFLLTDSDGQQFFLEQQRGKIVLVNFFATWCGPCMQELPHVQKLWDANRENAGFALIVIGREETDESITRFRMEHSYSFPMAADPDRSAYSLYAKELIPRTYLIARDGKICFASTGFYDGGAEKLELELAKQLRMK